MKKAANTTIQPATPPSVLENISLVTLLVTLHNQFKSPCKRSEAGNLMDSLFWLYGKCPLISNTLFHTFFGINFAFYEVVS